jgi:hypothetical protein
MISVCDVCNRQFEKKHHLQKACSTECSLKNKLKIQSIKRGSKEKTKKCLVCNKEFITFFSNKKFCSSKCQQKFNQYTERAKLENKKKYALNKKLYKKRSKSRYSANKEEILKKQKVYLKNLSDEKKILIRKNKRNWYKTPKGRAHSRQLNQNKRRLIKIQTPKWNDKSKTLEIFRIASKMENLMNKYADKNKFPRIKMNVDHIIPLKGITFEEGAPVSGLNVWYNLMPTLETDNKHKQSLCPPSSSIGNHKTKYLTLDKLPKPKHWLRFVRLMFKGALELDKEVRKPEEIIKSYIEVNPRNLKQQI